MAGFLDFLSDVIPAQARTPGINPDAPADGGSGLLGGLDPQMMQPPVVEGLKTMQAPESLEQPEGGLGGFLKRLTATSPEGVTFADKLYATGGVLAGDQDPMSRIEGKRADFKASEAKRLADERQAAQRAKQSAALKAAYVNGRFNPQAYIEAMAGDVTGEELAGFTKLAPKGGVDGGYAYTTDPFTGQTTFGDQRPISRAEELAQQRFDEQERRNQVLEDIARGRLGVAQGQLGVSRDRLNRPSGGGAAPQPAQPSAPRISNPAQLQALPPGSLYIAPDGTTRRKR